MTGGSTPEADRRRRRRWAAAGVLLTALGAAYGALGALQNRNPHYEPGAPPAPLGATWSWEPSPLWLPSYLLCVVPDNGYGIARTRSGYMFRTAAERRTYTLASTALGAALGLAPAGMLWTTARVRGRLRG